MTERETLRAPPFECPECGQEYQRLGRHWTSGDCDPVLSRDQREVVAGLALAGASIDRGSLRVANKRQRLVAWTADQLGWLATSATRLVSDDLEQADTYELTTPTHHALERYESWSDGPPSEYTPSPRAARVWWAYAGGLQWQGPYDSQRSATVSALHDDRADWVCRILAAIPVDISPTRVEKRVQWSGPAVDAWLDWLGDPVPGVEYKWADSLVEYRTLRENPATDADYQVAYCRHALEVAAERTDQPLDADLFEQRVEVVDADTVADVLGGGDFDAACSVVGVGQT